ncbi:hypothetical protein [Streptomyces sp. ISL-96]|uniref:hypothetical protein n=1 Tax=Streptomyces sp. ISL-96 TaxID=2819191 RepID=UPI0020353E90|nr:hypothetical protein [Streptomyces sp. ISL-96]
MRNPVGPLPSSIYWRRRAVALSLLVLLALVILWIVMSAGGSGDKNDGAHSGATPAPSTITPGPDSSGPAITEDPGGRGDPRGTDSGGADNGGSGSSDGGDGDGGGGGEDGGGAGTDAGSGGAGASDGATGSGGAGDGGGDGSGEDGGAGAGGGSGFGGGGGGGGQRVPAGSSLPDCNASTVELSLRSVKNEYEPGEKPKFELIAENLSGAACKVDFGPKAAVLTITDDDNKTVWSSKDCPRAPGSMLLRVPAHSTIKHTVEWDLKRSEPKCETPSEASVGDGTYLLEMPGAKSPAAFTLKKD